MPSRVRTRPFTVKAAAHAAVVLTTLTTLFTFAPALHLDARQSARPASSLPKVRLIATGGTISNRTGSRLTAAELLASMPGIERYARAESEQFANTSSSALTLDQWLALAKRINTLLADDPELAGVVVSSGTDTLEETAYFLNLTVRSDKPVVVVGSMRNPSTLGYEGAANLLDGFRVAAEPQSRGKGVLVVLNDEINAAREVTKTDALRLQTFQTRGYGVLGVVDSDRVVYYRDVVKRHTKESEFDVDCDPGASARGRRDGLSGRERRRHQGTRRSGRQGDRDCLGWRGSDERHPERRNPLCRRQGGRRRHEHSRRRWPHRVSTRRNHSGARNRTQTPSHRVHRLFPDDAGLPRKISRRSRRGFS